MGNADIDFTSLYKKGDIIYLVRCIENVGIQEIKKLKLRTIMKTYMVGSEDKGGTIFIGRDMLSNIFSSNKDAKSRLDQITKNIKIKIDEEVPNQLQDIDEDEDNIDLYINCTEEGDEDE